MGIFGGIGRAITRPGANSGLSFADRLAIFGTAASGDFETAMGIRNAPAKRAQLEALQAANSEAGGLFQPVPGQMREIPGELRQMPNMEIGGGPISASIPQYQRDPSQMRQGPSRQRSPQEVAQGILKHANVPGFDPKPFLDAAEYARPDMKVGPGGEIYNSRSADQPERFRNPTNVNGWITDLNKPQNEGQYLPALPSGMIPNGRGGADNITGLTTAMGEQTQAETTGRTMGTVFNRQDPRTGATTPTLGRDMFTPGGVGPGQTQSRADAIRAEAAATGEAERGQGVQDRGAAAPKNLAATAQMRALLPDIVAGFASGTRLDGLRALSLLPGNEDAKRKVMATQTFVNQGRILVAGIIKTFGSNPTEGERAFAEKMEGADMELSVETLAEGIRLSEMRAYRDARSAGVPMPPAMAPPASRKYVRNQVYQTPRGPLVWTGTGWVQP